MNKGILKKFLIIMGLILLGLDFIICLSGSGDVFSALFAMAFETFVEFGELKSILSIFGITFLTFGLLIQEDKILNKKIDNNKKFIVKYQFLRILGYIPFIYSLFGGIYYGFDELIFATLFFWPLYIIGIVLIIKSSSKIKSFKELENQNISNQSEQAIIKKKNLKLLITIGILLCIAIIIFVSKYLIFI